MRIEKKKKKQESFKDCSVYTQVSLAMDQCPARPALPGTHWARALQVAITFISKLLKWNFMTCSHHNQALVLRKTGASGVLHKEDAWQTASTVQPAVCAMEPCTHASLTSVPQLRHLSHGKRLFPCSCPMGQKCPVWL